MLVVALLILGACALDGAELVQPNPWGDDDDDVNLYDSYNAQAISSSEKAMTLETPYTRVRRNDQTTTPVRTLSPDEIREVKGALNKIMVGRDIKTLSTDVTDLLMMVDRRIGGGGGTPSLTNDGAWVPVLSTVPVALGREKEVARTPKEVVVFHFWFFERRNQTRIKPDLKTVFPLMTDIKLKKMNQTEYCTKRCVDEPLCKSVVVYTDYYTCDYFRFTIDDVPKGYKQGYNYYATYLGLLNPLPTTTLPPTTDNFTTSVSTTPAPPIIDIKRLVQIIANLTMNTIESNLTELFNQTLQKYGIPMCGETTTTEEPTYDFANATIVSKCFVCGMEDSGIPQNAYCADAFAGDFLPLVPVDPRAKGQIARYRKYCRYLDVPGTIINETQPRSVFGRWTGGCSVRWIDLSGVYTQRACRNRRHAVMGVHYVSKRMAKLEMALKNEDNGCIISPMSSLVPLSRGVSLYARFHACVCSGNWCNNTPRLPSIQLAALATLTTVAILA